ncbi:MAG TPA: DsbA family protein [Polyangia bacterium]
MPPPLPTVAWLIGTPSPRSVLVTPPAPPPENDAPASPPRSETPDLPFGVTGQAAAPVERSSQARPDPVLPPIAPAELHALVAPAVVALVVAGGRVAPRIVTGVLTTASGLVLTSRRALADVVEGNAGLSMVRGGPHGRLGAHELADAVPARIIQLSIELDLALVEALPSTSVFYPHLPVARRSSAADAAVLAVGHSPQRGLWAATSATLAPAGGARWLRAVSPADATPLAELGLGTPLVDAVGRIVGLITEPQPGAPRAVDAAGLLRFMLTADAPARRFAGVPPYRRSAVRASQTLTSSDGAAVGPSAGPVEADAAELPKVSDKGALDRRFQARPVETPRPSPHAKKASGPTHVSFDDAANAAVVTAVDLDRHPPVELVSVEVDDVPDRGPRGALVTIIELGDYHATETRNVEATVRAFAEGPDAHARVLWKDADRGDGAAYQLAARAARAAREQDEFWAMHDRLMKATAPPRAEDVRKLARALELDMNDFQTVFESDGLLDVLEGEADKASRVPALATPSFVVNGHVVDGGSVAGPALREAVNEELAMVEARLNKQPVAGVATARCRQIAAGKPIAGTTFDAEVMARTVAAAASRNAARGQHASAR